MENNGLFVVSDPQVNEIGGFPLNPSWWSRMYEYPWAIQFARPGSVVADMGAGWSGRPFKDALAKICKKVYAVDLDERLLELPRADNIHYVIADFTREVPILKVDTIFCISVLEDIMDIQSALENFKFLLKPGGQIVFTTDTPWDQNKPTPKYPGTNMVKLLEAVAKAGLDWIGPLPALTWEPSADLVHHEEWNLAVLHGLVR